MHSPLYSAPLLSFKFSLFSNLLSLCFSGISDCDESYNYWEPLHYLITSGVGGGFQTWEYSPNIRLRMFIILSISRLLALIFGYSAPVFLIRHLPDPPPNGFFLCLARDWHLFPGRILLPGNIDRWKVGLLPSDFQGQLPSQYPVTSIPSQINVASSTRQDGGKFNLMNKEELDRYIPIDKCNYILDRDTSPGRREYDYFRDSKNWRSMQLDIN
ncbi:unnamed protein product [Protopolystoma xenopodis]|uniref:Mannosyltransferase n=1 Tax=Protopolystoma xenopodis TaxID=117903 RepID=A0A448WWU8_9PLAT|nr:unnamed protein product [Protopolystoma xenopodis]